MRYIRPLLASEDRTPIPVSSIISYGYENGYTAIYTQLRRRPFLACASEDEIRQDIGGAHNGW
tara:strand:+ start:327 stop:515 length:189 start_codon:yes stop_codon:yes gene_type:complete